MPNVTFLKCFWTLKKYLLKCVCIVGNVILVYSHISRCLIIRMSVRTSSLPSVTLVGHPWLDKKPFFEYKKITHAHTLKEPAAVQPAATVSELIFYRLIWNSNDFLFSKRSRFSCTRMIYNNIVSGGFWKLIQRGMWSATAKRDIGCNERTRPATPHSQMSQIFTIFNSCL